MSAIVFGSAAAEDVLRRDRALAGLERKARASASGWVNGQAMNFEESELIGQLVTARQWEQAAGEWPECDSYRPRVWVFEEAYP